LKAQWHPLAEKEAAEARIWYGERSLTAAERFTDALEQTIRLLISNPGLFAIRAYGLRIAVIQTFPYSVVYRESAKRLLIVAIAHAKRRPGYWRNRIS
jgi:plasmid stabilization system protein ParE